MVKTIFELGLDDLIQAGLTINEAKDFEAVIKQTISATDATSFDPGEVWRQIVAQRLLKPSHPHELHQLVYYSIYANWDVFNRGPPLYWFPSL